MNMPQRPDQAVSPPPLVVSPGGAAGTFRGKLVVIFGTGNNIGLFVYNPSPASGNLKDSITALGEFDAYGNATGQGFTSYTGNTASDLFMSLNQAGLSWGTIANLTAGTGALAIGGPVTLRIQNTLLATDPSAAGTNESWHTLSLAAGWSTVGGQPVPSYRLLPDGNVQLTGVATHAGFSVNTQLSTAGALPSAYQPSTLMVIGGNANGDAVAEVSTAGTVTAAPGSLASATACRFNGTYPVNL